MGFADKTIGKLWNMKETDVFELRKSKGIVPVYKMIDTCASEFESYIPYFYSTYEEENESIVSDKKKVIVLGSGPVRIGQGVEFDYSTVHAVKTIKGAGYEAIIINNNPETVSTDYTCSDKLYFLNRCVPRMSSILSNWKSRRALLRPLEDRRPSIWQSRCGAGASISSVRTLTPLNGRKTEMLLKNCWFLCKFLSRRDRR